jgi:hypothetical protein
MIEYFTLLFFVVAFQRSSPLLKIDFLFQIIIWHLVVRTLASLFFMFIFFVDLSQSHISG